MISPAQSQDRYQPNRDNLSQFNLVQNNSKANDQSSLYQHQQHHSTFDSNSDKTKDLTAVYRSGNRSE